MEKTRIRTDIMNLTSAQWYLVHRISHACTINVTPKELIDLIGFGGGMFFSGKANEQEKQFIDDFYKIGRNEQDK